MAVILSLDLSLTIPCSDAHGIGTQEVVNKTTPKSIFDTIYFNQISKVLERGSAFSQEQEQNVVRSPPVSFATLPFRSGIQFYMVILHRDRTRRFSIDKYRVRLLTSPLLFLASVHLCKVGLKVYSSRKLQNRRKTLFFRGESRKPQKRVSAVSVHSRSQTPINTKELLFTFATAARKLVSWYLIKITANQLILNFILLEP